MNPAAMRTLRVTRRARLKSSPAARVKGSLSVTERRATAPATKNEAQIMKSYVDPVLQQLHSAVDRQFDKHRMEHSDGRMSWRGFCLENSRDDAPRFERRCPACREMRWYGMAPQCRIRRATAEV